MPPVADLREWIERVDAIGELTRIEAACNELGAFAAAHPDRQPDAVKK